MTDIETEVRRMLHRRAADIADTADTADIADTADWPGGDGGAPGDAMGGPPLVRPGAPIGLGNGAGPTARPRRPRPLQVAAVLIVVVGGLVAALALTLGRDGSSSVETAQTAPSTPATTGPTTSTETTSQVDDEAISLDPADVPTVDEVISSLQSAVDLWLGPPVSLDWASVTAEEAARYYLDDRLDTVEYHLVEGETLSFGVREEADDTTQMVATLTAFRWVVSEADGDTTGVVVVRADAELPGVVVAVTDGVEVVTAERDLEEVRVEIRDAGGDPLPVEMTTILGDPVPADGPVGPIPIVIRARPAGASPVSVTELALNPIGFPEVCGTEPPVSIEVGDLAGPLEPGPAPGLAHQPALVNQQVWHHPGPFASLEIRWPADPLALARLTPEEQAERTSFGTGVETTGATGEGPYAPGPATAYVAGALDPPGSGPCRWFQVTVHGDPGTVDWWSTAISGELSFGMPLTIAELDPSLEFDGGGEPPPDELIVDTQPGAEVPSVPATGSCDGLPDAPPRTGPGPGTYWATPAGALEDLLTVAPTPDVPLPTLGYTEYPIDESNVSFAVSSHHGGALVTVTVQHEVQGWTVTQWAAAAC